MTEEHKQKIRQTHLRLAHGEGWTEEDQKNFERERNNRQCRNYRKKHKEEFNGYQNAYQKKFRDKFPSYYKYFQRYRKAKKSGYTCSFEEFCKENNYDITEK